MQYTVYDLHQCSRGERVQVTLQGNAANVRLMDSSNYNNYKTDEGIVFMEDLLEDLQLY